MRSNGKRFGLASALTVLLVGNVCAGGRAGAAATPGSPRLATFVAVVSAGGGAANFKATTLIGALAGSNAGSDVVALVKRNGAAVVKRFTVIFDFAVADALHDLRVGSVTLPAPAAVVDGKALVAELYAAGADPRTGTYSAGYMLDRLLAPRLHARIMHDIDVRFGPRANAAFERALQQIVERLQMSNGSEPGARPDEKA